MIITKVTSELGRFGVKVETENYDGAPAVSTLWFERQPRHLHHDRLLLAAYLAFGHHCAGRIATGKKHSPALAEAVGQDAAPVWLQVPDVELYAKPIPRGSRSASVEVPGLTSPHAAGQSARLTFPRADLAVGTMWDRDEVFVPTNAAVVALGQPHRVALRVALACGVLHAEDYGIDAFIIRPREGEVSADESRRLVSLLSTVGLGLILP